MSMSTITSTPTTIYPDLYSYNTARDEIINNEETTVADFNKLNERLTDDIKKDYKAVVRKIVIMIKANTILFADLIKNIDDKSLNNEEYITLLDIDSALDKAKKRYLIS